MGHKDYMVYKVPQIISEHTTQGEVGRSTNVAQSMTIIFWQQHKLFRFWGLK